MARPPCFKGWTNNRIATATRSGRTGHRCDAGVGTTPAHWSGRSSEAERRRISRLEQSQASSKGRRCNAHQEARQELLWLQAQCESVDSKHGFIRGVATGTASEHHGHHFDEVLDTDHTGRQVRADKAYSSRQRKDMLGVLGFKDEMQRKAETRQASERMPKATQSAHRQETRQGRTCMSLQAFGTWAVSSSARLDRPVRAPQ